MPVPPASVRAAPPRALREVLLVHFIGTFGFSVVLPFLVFMVERFGGSAVAYGLIGATYPAFQLIGAPILGRWSDRFGRRRVLLFSQAGTLLSWCVFAAALFVPPTVLGEWGAQTLTLPLLLVFLARALDGLTGGNISVANAYVADISSEEERSRNYGRMGIAANFGFIAGPLSASALVATRWGEAAPIFAALGISLAATLLIGFRLPETNPCVLRAAPRSGSVRKLFGQEQRDCVQLEGSESLAAVLRLPGIARMLAIYLVLFFGFNVFYTSFPIHASTGLGWGVGRTGVFFAVMSGAMVLVQGPLLARVSRRVSEPVLVVFGCLVLTGSFLLLRTGSSGAAFAAALAYALGNGLMWPSFLGLLSRQAGDRHQGAVQGFAGSAGSLASILGLVLGGILYQRLGPTTFLVAAAAMLVSAVASLTLPRAAARKPGSAAAPA